MKHLGKSFFITLLLISFSINVLALGPKGNWTERFNLKGGNYIEHTPYYVSLSGSVTVGKEMHIMTQSFNGLPISHHAAYI